MPSNINDLLSGLVFVAVGLLYGAMAWTSLPIGSALGMGPGYFPILLSGILVLLGLAIAARSFVTQGLSEFGAVPWRGLVVVTAAIVFFAFFFESLGILPSVLGAVIIASYASTEAKFIEAMLAGLFMGVLCAVVFGYFLGLPVRMVGPLFGSLSF